MGSIVDSPAIPKLTALERIGPKGYVRYVFPFQLQENYSLDEVARVLQAGYEDLMLRMPEVACEAVPDTHSKQKGVMKYQRLQGSDAANIVTKDLRDSFPSSYTELKSKSFPVAAFDADTLCRRSVWASAGERLPISLVQANFIQGGLILTWCILHLAGDGTSFCTWTKI